MLGDRRARISTGSRTIRATTLSGAPRVSGSLWRAKTRAEGPGSASVLTHGAGSLGTWQKGFRGTSRQVHRWPQTRRAAPAPSTQLTYDTFFVCIDGWLTANEVVVVDAGFPLGGARRLHIPAQDGFAAQAAWLAIGSSVGAGASVSCASPDKRGCYAGPSPWTCSPARVVEAGARFKARVPLEVWPSRQASTAILMSRPYEQAWSSSAFSRPRRLLPRCSRWQSSAGVVRRWCGTRRRLPPPPRHPVEIPEAPGEGRGVGPPGFEPGTNRS